jgi:hypothetical protein
MAINSFWRIVRLDPTRDLLDAVLSQGSPPGTHPGADGSRSARSDSTHKKEPHSTHSTHSPHSFTPTHPPHLACDLLATVPILHCMAGTAMPRDG